MVTESDLFFIHYYHIFRELINRSDFASEDNYYLQNVIPTQCVTESDMTCYLMSAIRHMRRNNA